MRLPWNDIRGYVGAPKRRDRRDLLLTSMEGDMPANAPYPGESLEEFIARTGGGMPAPMAGGDPRAAAMAKMFGNPATNPANTLNMGRTTENYLDPMVQGMPGPGPYGMDQGQMAPDLQQFHAAPAMSAPGTVPIEEMLTNEGGGGDSFYADAFGAGYDQYALGLPGAEGPPSRMQLRNRRVMHPELSDDEAEQQDMLGTYDASEEADEAFQRQSRDRPVSRDSGEKADDMSDDLPNQSAESEQGMIQRQINKAGSLRDQGEQRRMLRDYEDSDLGPDDQTDARRDYGPGNPGLSGDNQADDEAFLRELMADGYENIDEIIQQYKELWGDLPEDLRDDSERDFQE